MDSFQSVLGDAAGGALCNLLTAYGDSAPFLAAVALAEPTPVGEAATVAAGLATLAASVGCQWDMDKPGPPVDIGWEGCSEFSIGEGWLYGDDKLLLRNVQALNYIDYTEPQPTSPPGITTYDIGYVNVENGQTLVVSITTETVEQWRLEPRPGAVCDKPAPGPLPPPQPDPYIHTDTASGCEIKVDFKGWAVESAGTVGGVWQMQPAAQTEQASGGVIGGCNFLPTIYYDNGGSGGGGGQGPISFPVPDPVPPDTDTPWWAPILAGAAAGAAGAAVEKALDALFDPIFPGGSYSVDGVCEVDSNGDPMPVTYSSNYPPGKAFAAIIDRLDALGDLPNYSKQLRQPTCMGCVKQGAPVTIHFESIEPSSNGMHTLRKQLTYYDQTGSPLQVHASHWKDFSWEAGPFVVTHQGANWGKLVVWGATAEEGKRVIRHAGDVAGINPDSSGYWHVHESSAPRYGRSGTMRVEVRPKRGNGDRYLMVTKRDSPKGLPLAVVLQASDF